MKPLITSRGRTFVVVGDASVLTMDRLAIISERLDADPRIASVSVVAHPDPGQEFVRATAPAGCAIAIATDVEALTGPIPAEPSLEDVKEWSVRASERGLSHDWWLSSARDIARSPEFMSPTDLDQQELQDPATAQFTALNRARIESTGVSITVDATWLGPHQTGAQVLTTAAIEALAKLPNVARLRLVGLDSLPAYATHLGNLASVDLVPEPQPGDMTDVIWHPNQIDQRVDITAARSLGRRIVTTYLDLIAYDIPLYHASTDAWAAYRSMQRRIALSVDGITTISADVADRLRSEVPRLDPQRVQPIPLGLDHITATHTEPGEDITDLVAKVENRPFVLVLGNDFQHKNRDFAIRVWEEVLDRGINCDLVLAGLHVKSSSSKAPEDELLAQHTNLRGSSHSVGHVSEASREWLLASASAVLYPSSAEGFGFVPYEAATFGTPTTFTSFGPLVELTGVQDVPHTWSVNAYADDLAAILTDSAAAQTRVESLRTRITELTWELFATRLVNFMYEIDQLPPAGGSLVAGTASDAAALNAILSSRTWRVTKPLRKLGQRKRRS